MRAVLAIIAALIAVSAAAPLTEGQYQSLFSKFVSQFDKQYNSNGFFTKYNTFKTNLDTVMAHNAQGLEWTQAINEFGDLTAEEFTAKMGLKPVKANYARAQNLYKPKNSTANKSKVDWIKEGKVNGVQNQGQCGSCWAFSAIGSLETTLAVEKGELLKLSEQELVDCGGEFGNNGCRGGLMRSAFEYTTEYGIATLDNYPYTARDGTCKRSSTPRAAKTTGHKNIATDDENALLKALDETAVAIAVDATVLQFYSGGIINEGCSSNLNHGVVLVGKDEAAGVATIRNSWGKSWGEDGNVRVKTGINALCYASDATVPLV